MKILNFPRKGLIVNYDTGTVTADRMPYQTYQRQHFWEVLLRFEESVKDCRHRLDKKKKELTDEEVR